MFGRRHVLSVALPLAAALVVSGVVAAAPAAAATVGLAPTAGSPVELGERALGPQSVIISITNTSGGNVVLDHVDATSDDPTVYFHSDSIGALGPGSIISAGQSFDLSATLNASRPGAHTLALDLGDSVEGQWPGTVHEWLVPVHVTISGTTTSTTTLTGPASAVPGETAQVSGTVSDPAGMLPGAAVSLTRTDGTGTTTLAPATADASGAFTRSVEVGVTDVVVTATFSDAHHSVSTASWTIASRKVPSSLTLVAPATVVLGTRFTVAGVLTNAGEPVPGVHLTVTRRSLLGTTVSDLVTGTDGAYSFRYVATVGGPHLFTASWAGDATRAPVVAKSTTTVPRTATAVVIRTSATRYVYGAYATITVRLGSTYNSRVVSVYARPLGTSLAAPGVRIARVFVPVGGTATVRYRMLRRTAFTAAFAGDYRTAPVARAVTAEVLTAVTLTMVRPIGRSGVYYLYRRATDIPMTTTVRPGRPYGCVTFVLQRLVSGSWRTVAVASCVGLSKYSALVAYAYSTAPRGTKYRVRASVKANAYSSAAASPLRYFMLR